MSTTIGLNGGAYNILGGHESLFRVNKLYLVSKSDFEILNSLSANMRRSWDPFMILGVHDHYLEEFWNIVYLKVLV